MTTVGYLQVIFKFVESIVENEGDVDHRKSMIITVSSEDE